MDELTVKVKVDTEAEMYPVLVIYEGDGQFEIPAALLAALRHAQEMVDIAEGAIMAHIDAAYPNVPIIVEWLHDHRG